MLTRYRQIAAFAFGCGMISLLAPAARAQFQPPAGQVRTITYPKVHSTGEFVGMSGASMKCILDGSPVIAQFIPKPIIKVTGSATADAIAAGMYVQFKGTFTRYGKGTEPIKDVVIYTPDAATQPGAYAAGGGALDEPATGKKKGPAPTTTMYQISGKITSMHKYTVSVDCGNMKVKAEIAPDATVKLDTSDLSWAAPGDKLSFTGANLGNGRALASEVTIQLAAPLTGKKKSHVYHAPDKATDNVADKTADKSAKTTDKADKPADKAAAPDKTPPDKTAPDKADKSG